MQSRKKNWRSLRFLGDFARNFLSMKITPCSKNDIPNLISVARQSYKEHYLHLWYDGGDWYLQNNFTFEQFSKELSDPNAALFLISEENISVGFIKLNINKGYENYSDAEALELERIYFLKSAAGRGLGKATIEFIAEFANQKNKSVVWLKTMDSAPSVEFYKKVGFTILGDYFLPYQQMKVEYRGMFVMIKALLK